MKTKVLFLFLLIANQIQEEHAINITTNNPLVFLKSQLFTDYDAETRPFCNNGDPTNVTTDIDIQQIVEVVTKDHKASIAFTVYLKWVDCNLTWNPRDHQKLNYISVPNGKTWSPDVRVINGINEDIQNFETLIFNNGTVLKSFQLIVDIKCRVNIAKFPYDSQTCYIDFDSWPQDNSAIDLQFGESTPNTLTMYPHEEWQIQGTGVTKGLITYNNLDNVFAGVEYYMELERRPNYYEENVLFPVVIFIIATVFTFFISPGDVAIDLTTNLLLAFTVLLSFVTDELPKTSKTTCWFSVFLLFIFTVISVTLLLHVITQSIQLREGRMPSWIEKYIMRPLTIVTECSYKRDKLVRLRDSEKWQRMARQLNRVAFCLVCLCILIGSNYLFNQLHESSDVIERTQISSGSDDSGPSKSF